MPRPRYQNLADEKKQALLGAAVREFAAHGFEHASINTILDEAGFSKGSFYYYFDDKLDLAIELVTQIAEESIAPLRELKRPTTPDEYWAEMRAMAIRRFELMKADRARYDAMVRLANTLFKDHDRAKTLRPVIEARQLMAGFFESGVAVGAIRTDVPVGVLFALLENMKLTAYQSMFPGDTVPTDAQMNAFADLVIDLAKRITRT